MEPPRQTLPPVEEVSGSGVWSIPLPIPDNPLGYVFAYALEIDNGVVLIDVGWNSEETYDALVDGLGTVGAAIRDVRGVLVTHIHPDHYGLAGRIRNTSGAWIGLHPADAALIHERYEDVDDLLSRMETWLVRAGATDDAIEELVDASLSIRQLVVAARPDRLIEDDEVLHLSGRSLRAIHTPGHTPGHLCFVVPESGLIFTGDHVLPRITPHVGSNPQSTANPLGDFLGSLGRIRGQFSDSLVLPGHEYRFRDLDRRLEALVVHHVHRMDEIEKLVASGSETTWDVARRTTWSRGWDKLAGYMRRMAVAEVHAHLVHLEKQGRLVVENGHHDRWRSA